MNQKPLRILMTNDDGPKSPFVAPFLSAVAALETCGELRFAFPAEEQSWIGQAVTRFRPIYTAPHGIGSQRGFLVCGTPADCVGLALHHLYPDPADIVISGINVGMNSTLPFHLNSGTVGGARQAMTFGVRAISFSSLVPEELFGLWREEDLDAMKIHAAEWERVARVCAKIAGRLMSEEYWSGVDIFSVDVPWRATEETPLVLTEPERGTYLPLYTPGEKGSFAHHFRGFRRGDAEGGALPSDLETVQEGRISVTPVKYELRPKDSGVISALRELLGT